MSWPHTIRMYWTREAGAEWRKRFYDTQHPRLVEMREEIARRTVHHKRLMERALLRGSSL